MNADMPTSFWGGWVVVITVVSLAALVWLLFSIYFGSGKIDEQQHVTWDENLNEGTHAPPLWWFWLIFSAMIITVIYLMLYPGLGTFAGMLKWSQGHRLEESYQKYNDTYSGLREQILALPIADLQQDELLMTSARGVFDRNCAACHGPEGTGMAQHFPNLRDEDWQWGGTAEQIEQTLRNGRRAAMPAWSATLDDTRIAEVIAHLRSLGPDAGAANPAGQQTYTQFCAGCHGPGAQGNSMLGAPNLTDAIWLYGGDDAALSQTLKQGRNGMMPAFGNRLSDVQIRLLIAWLTQTAD